MKSNCDLPVEWSVGETILGRYEVRDMFEGGMGKVFRVFDLEWGREMAVKIPHQRLLTRPEIKKSFEEECLTWINMGLHPNIAPCHYIKTVGQNFCIFSEFITGGSLLDLIRSRRLYHENSSEESVRRIVYRYTDSKRS